MAKTSLKSSGPDAVAACIAGLTGPQQALAAAARALILDAAPGFTEGIKWAAPSFCYGGTDRITFHLRRPGLLLLIFHTGAKGTAPVPAALPDPAGVLQWAAPDRATVTLDSPEHFEALRAPLQELVRQWVGA